MPLILGNPLPSTRPSRSTPPTITGPAPYKTAFERCQALFTTVFLSEANSRDESFRIDDEDASINTLPELLDAMVGAAEPNDQGNVTYGICMGMMTLANANPTYIDSFLNVYCKAMKLAPSGRSEGTLESNIFMNMAETCNTGYRTNDFWASPVHLRPGTSDPLDASNLNFTKEDVEENLDNVLRNSQRQAHEGNDYIVRAAMYARFAVMMKESYPHMVDIYQLDAVFRKTLHGAVWIKADLIAALVRLRGYAKSVSEELARAEATRSKMDEWQTLLRRWLYDPDLNTMNDPMVKHHVIVSVPPIITLESLKKLTRSSLHWGIYAKDRSMRRAKKFSMLETGFFR